jgi:hypothetical protein
MLSRETSRFETLVDGAARGLVTAQHHAGGAFISLPVLYPSGSGAVVLVQDGGERCFVSDGGMGHEEATLIGGGPSYAQIARQVAERSGIGFDNQCFFVVQATRAQLPGAIATVASASVEAATLVAYRLADRRGSDFEEFVWSRLARVFPTTMVVRDPKRAGHSSHVWSFSAEVTWQDRRGTTLFEAVANHHASVASAAMKFHDVARLEAPPRRVAVVRHRQEMGTLVGVLAQAADVIEAEASEETLTALARAA